MPANPRARSSSSSSSMHHRISSAPLNCHQQQQQQNHRQYRQLFSPATGADRRIVDAEAAAAYHTHEVGPEQVCSAVVQEVRAPLDTVWSVVRRFDKPQGYKNFVKSCDVVDGDGVAVGTLRRVHVVSGLPAHTSMERLEILDDERHVLSFSVVGGEHRLSNYRSITTLHRLADQEEETTFVVESYVVDTPPGNTNEETCVFVDTIVRCNLHSLAHIAENSARRAKEIDNNNSSSSAAPNLN